MGYQSVTNIDNAIVNAAGGANAAFTTLIPLPEPSWEGRPSHAVRIAGSGTDRIGVYLLGGLHAREWGSSDILVRFIDDLTQAYRTNHGLAYGGKSFTAAEIQSVVDGLNLYVFPQANPDGRQYSMTTEGMWRKNRRPDPNPGDMGVDLNRNFDWLWHYPTYFSPSAPVVSSTTKSSEIYIGPSQESEPETRNVMSLVNSHPDIRFFVDLHSFSQLILFGWGDDEMQSADPAKTFSNPAYDGQRGVSADAYSEFLGQPDRDLESLLGTRMRDAIVAAGGPAYSVEPSYALYPTSGSSCERMLGRWFLDKGKGKIHGYTIEWGTEFQPPWATMSQIVDQVCAALLDLCLGILATHSDVMIRDNAADTGAGISSTPFWESPDIVIRHADDDVFVHQDPLAGQDNVLYVRVTNRGPHPTRPMTVSARVAAFTGSEFVFPHDWTTSDATHVAPAPLLDTFDAVAPGDTRIAKFQITAAQVATLGSWIANGWHPCLLADVDCVSDFSQPPGAHVWESNNLAQRNITVLPAVAGAELSWAFLFGHELRRYEDLILDIELVDVPRKVEVAIDLLDDTLRFPAFQDAAVGLIRHRAPALTGKSTAGRTDVPAELHDLVRATHGMTSRDQCYELTLQGGRGAVHLAHPGYGRSQAVLRVCVPQDAKVGDVYRIRVAQRDGDGPVVGGVTLEIPIVTKS
jgi:carboxypeptidase T